MSKFQNEVKQTLLELGWKPLYKGEEDRFIHGHMSIDISKIADVRCLIAVCINEGIHQQRCLVKNALGVDDPRI